MRAYALLGQGHRPAVADLPPPQPGDGEVLVRVAASSVNPHDAHVASGAAAGYMTYRFPVVLGSDLCGTVEALGAGVTDLEPGVRVIGLVRELVADRGSFGELVAVRREWVAPVPAGVDDASAGRVGPGFAHRPALRRCCRAGRRRDRPGHGATGGVGSYAVQILAVRSATVVATARSGEEEAHVRELGAVEVVDWGAGDLAEQVRALRPDGIAVRSSTWSTGTRTLSPRSPVGCSPSAGVWPGPATPPTRTGCPESAPSTCWPKSTGRATDHRRARRRRPGTCTDQPNFDFDRIDDAFGALRAGAVGKLAIGRFPATPTPDQRPT